MDEETNGFQIRSGDGGHLAKEQWASLALTSRMASLS